MTTYGDSWLGEVSTQLRSVADALWTEVREHGVLALLEPVPPFNKPGFLSPAVAVGGLLAVLLLSGMAVSAFGGLLLTLLALYILLVDVFGFSVELNAFTK